MFRKRHSPSKPTSQSNAGLTIGRYRILAGAGGKAAILGRGCLGTTYKAVDIESNREVALKVVNPEYSRDSTCCRRLARGARVAESVRSSNVVEIYESNDEPGSAFCAMEWIRGATLAEVVNAQGPLMAADALSIVRQVSLALQAFENARIVHRDLKVSHIMLEDDGHGVGRNVKVIGFDLAKNTMPGSSDNLMLTKHGFVGSPVFASPEQLEEKELDIRSDIYSLGMSLWFLLVGDPPLEANSLAGLIRAHLSERPVFTRLEGQPAPVADLLERMLAKNPGDRPAGAMELREEIEGILRGLRGGRAEHD